MYGIHHLSPILCVQMETASLNNGIRYYLMAVTPTRLHFFTGFGALEFMELPGEIPNSELHFFLKQRRAVHFAWLSGAGIYHGGLNFGAQLRRYHWLCSQATARVFYAYDQNSIFQVSVNDEGQDMWKVHLDMKDYAAPLANCHDPLRRDQVIVQAEAAFASKDFLRAASFYAKDALRTFLLCKLDNLAKDAKCQISMISIWATELYLDKINRLLLEDDTALENHGSEYQSIIKEFRAFLSDCKDVLDEQQQ